VVKLINSKGYNSQITYKNRKYGEVKNLLSKMKFKEADFEFLIESEYKDDFEDCKDLLKELASEIKYSVEYLNTTKYLVLLKKSFDESFQAVVITDEEFNVVYYNRLFSEFLKDGITNLNEIFSNLDIEKDEPVERILIGRFDNKQFFLKAKIIPVYFDKKYYVFQSVVLSDNYTIMDSLTNLLNRRGFLEKNSLDSRKAVVVVDIYEFKSIIESQGKEYADEVLKMLASFLKKEISASEIGRVGGDEFAFIVEVDGIDLERFLNSLITKINTFLNLNVNIGVAIADEKVNNLEILLEKAYIALNKAIKKGINTYEIYDEYIGFEKKRFFIVQDLIKRAIKTDSVIFYFQPYVDENFKIVGAESLIRIKEKERIVPPSEFIDVAEESGLISEIEKIMFPRILEYAKSVDINLSFNLSAYSFINEEFYKSIPKVENLIIEITERIVSNMQLAKEKIDIIKSKNIKVAIDDFGTGYSNFISLKELDFDILKIDISFIRHLEKSQKDRAIVKSIIDFAKNLGLKTVAEGVESQKQVEILKDFGCDYLQGFYFYRPMPFEDLKKLLGGEK
jgi:diguanylate cyclase (GGDEF)-like protein